METEIEVFRGKNLRSFEEVHEPTHSRLYKTTSISCSPPFAQSEEKKLDVLTAKWTTAAQEVLAELVDKAPEEVLVSCVDCLMSSGVLLSTVLPGLTHIIECHDGRHAGVFPSRARGAFASYSCPIIMRPINMPPFVCRPSN
jgi:hypothetical protein